MVLMRGPNGAPTRTRTWNPLIKSQLLYQLSHGRLKKTGCGRYRANYLAGCCAGVVCGTVRGAEGRGTLVGAVLR